MCTCVDVSSTCSFVFPPFYICIYYVLHFCCERFYFLVFMRAVRHLILRRKSQILYRILCVFLFILFGSVSFGELMSLMMLVLLLSLLVKCIGWWCWWWCYRQVLKTHEPVYQAIWVDNIDFDEVLISPAMIQDHMPDTVLAALEKVSRKLFKFTRVYAVLYMQHHYLLWCVASVSLYGVSACVGACVRVCSSISHNIVTRRWCVYFMYACKCVCAFAIFHLILQHNYFPTLHISVFVSYSYCYSLLLQLSMFDGLNCSQSWPVQPHFYHTHSLSFSVLFTVDYVGNFTFNRISCCVSGFSS